MTIVNKKIKELINESGVKKFELAQRLNVSNTYLPVLLRRPLSDAQAKHILGALDKLVIKDVKKLNHRHESIQEELSNYSNDDDDNNSGQAEPVAQ